MIAESDLCKCGHPYSDHGEILGCTALRTPAPTPNTASTYDCPCLEFIYATEQNTNDEQADAEAFRGSRGD